MAKIDLDDVASGFNRQRINNNFQSIEDELNTKVLYRDNPTGEPNQMNNDLDMNSNDLINADTVSSTEVTATKVDTTTLFIDGVEVGIEGVTPIPSKAEDISYDNTSSGLSGTDVQAAIDEVGSKVSTNEADILSNSTAISNNSTSISTNAANIASNTAAIAALESIGNPSFIVNGAMAVSQENGFDPITNIVGDTYIADQWIARNNTGTGQIDSSFGELSGSRSIRQTVASAITAAAVTANAGKFEQKLEAQNIYHLNGGNITLSFLVNTNWSGKLPIALLNQGASRSYVTDVDVVSGLNFVSITVPLEANTVATNDNSQGLGVIIGAINSDLYEQPPANNDQWNAGLFLCSTDSTEWVFNAGNFVEITQVKLEEGTQATPFVHKLYSEDLADCQRYFYELTDRVDYSNTTYVMGTARFEGSSSGRIDVNLLTSMRTAPTMDTSAASDFRINQSSNFSLTTLTLGSATKNSVSLGFNTSGGATADTAGSFETSATGATAYIFFNARL